MITEPTTAIQVTARGAVRESDKAYAVHKIQCVLPAASAPLTSAHLVLSLAKDPARARPAHIEIGVAVNGVPIRAHVDAGDLHEAADLVQERLRRRIRQVQERAHNDHRRAHEAIDVGRAIGAPTGHPVEWDLLAPESRQIVRRKTFALRPMTAPEAADEMDLLDHDFYLFTDAETDRDSVVFRERDAGHETAEGSAGAYREDAVAYGLTASAVRLTEALARERLDLGGERFVFYRDPEADRGRVLYRRRDGHYGLITPV
jgi:ribosome-associated translation inhibitor RaiA